MELLFDSGAFGVIYVIGRLLCTFGLAFAFVVGGIYIIFKIKKVRIEKKLLSRELVAYDEGVFFDYPEKEPDAPECKEEEIKEESSDESSEESLQQEEKAEEVEEEEISEEPQEAEEEPEEAEDITEETQDINSEE